MPRRRQGSSRFRQGPLNGHRHLAGVTAALQVVMRDMSETGKHKKK